MCIHMYVTFNGLHLMACNTSWLRRFRPSAFVQLDVANSSKLKNTPRSRSANFAGCCGGVEFSRLNSARAASDGRVMKEYCPFTALLPQHTCSPVQC